MTHTTKFEVDLGTLLEDVLSPTNVICGVRGEAQRKKLDRLVPGLPLTPRRSVAMISVAASASRTPGRITSFPRSKHRR